MNPLSIQITLLVLRIRIHWWFERFGEVGRNGKPDCDEFESSAFAQTFATYSRFGLFLLQSKTSLDLFFSPITPTSGHGPDDRCLGRSTDIGDLVKPVCHSTASGQSQSLDAGSSILIFNLIVNLKYYTRRSTTQEILYTEPEHGTRSDVLEC